MVASIHIIFDYIPEFKKISEEITKKYGPEAADRTFSRDIFPKYEAPVIGKKRQVLLLKWGFPMKDSNQVVFNARAEGLTEKSMFKSSLGKRCLVPATSFYEWNEEKKKYRIAPENKRSFYLAGLWKEYIINGSKSFYFTIITTAPSKQMETIHNRMPAIITPDHSQDWLSDRMDALKLLRPYEKVLTIQPA